MSTEAPTCPLPQELLNLILYHVDDDPFLWMVGRVVSRAFHEEIEHLFLKTRLNTTKIYCCNDDMFEKYQYILKFARLSDDGTAYFTVQLAVNRAWLGYAHASPANISPEAAIDRFEPFLHNYQEAQKTMACLKSRAVTRIGSHFNDSVFSDVPIPDLDIHHASHLVSLDWKTLYSRIYAEEEEVHFQIEDDYLNNPILVTLPQVVHMRRFLLQMATQHTEKLVREAFEDLLTFIAHLRFSEIVAVRDLELAHCRGQLLYVERPGENGWKRYTNRQVPANSRQAKWYNHAWEELHDVEQDMTLDEEVEAVEAERMARAWEKGLD